MLRVFQLSALALGAVTASSVMDCQKILSTDRFGVVRTDVNPTGVTVPRGFVAAGAKQLCLASRGQYCEVIKARRCVVNGRARHSARACTYMSNGQRVSAPTTVKFASGKKMNLTGKQAQLVGAAVCFHAPQDHMVKPNDCQVRFNYKLPSGTMYRWAVSSGQHNVPTGKGALNSVVVAGKGCIALRYSEKNALGRPTPISEGYHPRFAQEVRSIQVLAPRTKVCNSGEELVSDKCVPCATGHLSRAGDNVCAKAQTCSHVAFIGSCSRAVGGLTAWGLTSDTSSDTPDKLAARALGAVVTQKPRERRRLGMWRRAATGSSSAGTASRGCGAASSTRPNSMTSERARIGVA